MTEKKMTRQEALEALNVFVKQEVDYESINILESIIGELMVRPGNLGAYAGSRILIGNLAFDYRYSEILKTAHELGLGPLRAAPWLARFQELIADIRKEYGLEQQHDLPKIDCGSGIGPV